MKCEEWIPRIEELFDGELGERETALVRLHMSSCESCHGFYQQLGIEQQLYSEAQSQLDVSPAMWQAVRERIGFQEQQPAAPASDGGLWARLVEFFARPRFTPAFAAVLVALAVGVTALVAVYLRPDQPGSTPVAVKPTGEVESEPKSETATADPRTIETEAGGADPPAPVRTARVAAKKKPPTPEDLIREAEEKYQSAIDILYKDVQKRRSQLNPETIARFDSALIEIDRAIAETRSVMRQNPADPVALQYLLVSYSKKVEVLQEMARLEPRAE